MTEEKKNIEVSVAELRKRKVFLATPMYGGQCSGSFAKSTMDLAFLAAKYQIDLKAYYLFNESLITRARNYLADEFMRSDFTHLMFIDSDIGFDPNDVLGLLAVSEPNSEFEIVCGPYPKKTISWEKIKVAVDKGFADQNPQDLEKYVGDYVFNPAKEQTEIQLDRPVEVLEGGTGFMMIQKSAFEKFKDKYPEFMYRPDHVRTKHFDGTRKIMMYFQALIDEKSERYLSEDYMFCQWAREAGVKTWLCPWMKTQHVGTYVYGGSLVDLAQIGAVATADISKPIKK